MNTSIYNDDKLDAMSADEAWDKFCYAAWVTRRDIRKHQPMQKAMAEHRARLADLVLKYMREHNCDEPACLVCPAKREAGL
jgi:hypothetical protein